MPAGAEMAARPRGRGAAGEKQRLGGEMAENARPDQDLRAKLPGFPGFFGKKPGFRLFALLAAPASEGTAARGGTAVRPAQTSLLTPRLKGYIFIYRGAASLNGIAAVLEVPRGAALRQLIGCKS